MKLFVDLDGVLADFDRHHEDMFGHASDKGVDSVDWSRVRSVDRFFANIPPMGDMDALWSFILPYRPIILSGVPPEVPRAADDKRLWVSRYLGSDVEVRCCRSREKCLHAEPGDILIDDWGKYRHLWISRGGVWVDHISASDSIRQLERLLDEGALSFDAPAKK